MKIAKPFLNKSQALLHLKSLIVSLIFQLGALPLYSQTNITLIIDHLKDQKVDSIKAFDYSQIEMKDPVLADTIQWSFHKKHAECYVLRFHQGKNIFHKQLWLDTGQVTVKAHLVRQNLIVDTVINSPVYYQIVRFQNDYSAILKNNDSLATNQFLLHSFDQFKDNPFSITVGVYYLLLNINSKENLLQLKSLTDQQGQTFKWHILYANLYDRLNAVLQQGKIDFNNFKFTNTENKKYSISLKGSKYTVINFWFLANKPSIQQHQSLKQNLDKFREKSIQLIGLSIDQNFENWSQYLTTTGLPWTNVLEPSKNLLSDFLYIDNFPTYLILDQDGKIIRTYFSFLDVMRFFNFSS